MSKAILVMDMPAVCGCCKFYKGNYFSNEDYCSCAMTGRIVDLNTKEAECPLRELPEKMDCFAEAIKNDCYDGTEYEHEYLDGKSDGWNACLDEILKECDADGNY